MDSIQLPVRIDRYAVFGEFGSGGMATVHFGRLINPVGFGRTVAIKRLRDSYARDPNLVRMLMDEARLAVRVNHPNVVQTLDVVVVGGETYIVMEYGRGVPLSLLTRRLRNRR